MQEQKIAIIGGGNLGVSIAQGLVKSALVAPQNIMVTRRKVHLIEHLKSAGIQTGADNERAIAEADIVILAVKPKHLNQILAEHTSILQEKCPILVSVITGVNLQDIQQILGDKVPLFRAMPNTAIAIQESMTCISTNNTAPEQKELIHQLFSALGKAVFIEDDLMAAATVLGACGIAYSMRYIRAASQGGIEIGFDANTAQLIAAQMVKGAAALLLETGQHPENEIDKVTTPQGCTIVGLNEMEHQGFSSALIKGIISSYNKIANISADYKEKS